MYPIYAVAGGLSIFFRKPGWMGKEIRKNEKELFGVNSADAPIAKRETHPSVHSG
jgi:hypothetical protein